MFFTPGDKFWDDWDFYGKPDDTTHGDAWYTSREDCFNEKLCQIVDGKVQLSVNTSDVQPKRHSHKIVSKKSFKKGVHIIDVEHMPTGCSTWPALWMFNPDWPNQGEIDIWEGVHTQRNNLTSLHTKEGCYLPDDATLKESDPLSKNCLGGTGCNWKYHDDKSYGPGFNEQKGGVMVINWTDESMEFQFIPRADVAKFDVLVNPPEELPADFSTAQFGDLRAKFDLGAGSACPNANSTFFGPQFYEINTTFCGDWAGNVWSQFPECTATGYGICQEFMANHPEAFHEAYWTVNYIRIYGAEIYDANEPNPPTPPTPPPSGGGCCAWGETCRDYRDWCDEAPANCTGACKGRWLPQAFATSE